MSKKINLASININQLNVLHTVIKEKNFSAAAKKLNLSQPSVSYGIKYLRDVFDDELIYKHPFSSEMILSPFCKSIMKPLENIISQLDSLLTKAEFNPNKDEKKFNIAISDYAACLLMPDLYVDMHNVNSSVSFETFYFDYKNIAAMIELNDVDIAIGAAIENFSKENNIAHELLFHDRIGCIVSKEHELASKEILNIEDFKRFPHLTHKSPVFKDIEPYKTSYEDYSFISNSNIANLSVIAESNLIGVSGKRLIDKLGKMYGVKWIATDFFVNNNFDVPVYFNKKNIQDKALQWLISSLKKNSPRN